MPKRSALLLLAGLIAVLGASTAHAHRGATGVVKQRMALMGAVGKSVRNISRMLNGATPFNAPRLRSEARKIASHGSEKMTRLFPKDSIKGPSTAVPEIWRDWDLFAAYANDMRRFALALARAAGNRRVALRAGAPPLHGPGGLLGGEREPINDGGKLARMAPEAAFGRMMRTCGACHTRFRRQR